MRCLTDEAVIPETNYKYFRVEAKASQDVVTSLPVSW